MAKSTRSGTSPTRQTGERPSSEQPMPEESPPADSPKIRSAADAVQRAKVELEKAQQVYAEVRQEAVERLEKVRETSIGDLIDATLDAVRKRPALGLGVAALIGLFLGRLFRR